MNLFIDESNENETHQIDLKYYVEDGAWELFASPAFRRPSEFEGQLYVEIFFCLWLRRKTIYYGINWIIPSILFLLSNVLGFSLEAECGEKITLRGLSVWPGKMFRDHQPAVSDRVPGHGGRSHAAHLHVRAADRRLLRASNSSARLVSDHHHPRDQRLIPFAENA